MKRIFIFIALLLPATSLLAQISEGGMPPSYSTSGYKSAEIIPETSLQSIAVQELLAEDESKGTPYRYGVEQDVALDVQSGLETQTENGTIWRYKLTSDSAKSVKLLFNRFVIPEGAQLYLYNKDYSVVYGAYTSANNSSDSTFVIADFPGKEVMLEYYEPSEATFSGLLQIDRVSLAYRDLDEWLSGTETDTTYLDVNCSEGKKWQLEKHAVCLYTFTEDHDSYLCSGALINNVKNDGTPYFLTANHCVSSSTVASTVVAYFNYETKGCGLEEKSYQTLSGASLITMGSSSDFTLLKFPTTPPASYQPYYAGWDLSDTASQTVCIHHPEGLLKKIALDNDPATTYEYSISWDEGSASPANTHWLVYFDEGATAGGSSGSPLFNEKKRIIGQLHGGGDDDSYYGKLNYSWDHSSSGSSQPGRSSTSYSDLSVYLAGDSTITNLDGYYPITNTPEAIFSCDYQYVCVGSPIPMTDYSLSNILKWKWEFTPSTVTFKEGTSENSQYPVVSFDAAGIYSVTLVVENKIGNDSVTYPSMITAGSIIDVAYKSKIGSSSCYYDLDSLVLTASGAFSYSWELDDASKPYFNLKGDDSLVAVIEKNPDYVIDSTINLNGIIVGVQGSCRDTSRFSYEFLLPYNDDIANAQLLKTGTNGPFTNVCASVEEGEPVPPVNACVSQTDWCDEYGTGLDIVENSVWFYFYGPESGSVSIEANDIDGQIALYESTSYSDILDGTYNLLAANDDISTTNANSKIKTTTVTSGKMYWLQFDGSGGGTQGQFYIVLNEENKDTSNVSSACINGSVQFTLYPQPATDYCIISSGDFNGNSNVKVKLYTSMGNLIYSEELPVQQNSVTVDLEDRLPGGIYIVSVAGSNFIATKKLIKESY